MPKKVQLIWQEGHSEGPFIAEQFRSGQSRDVIEMVGCDKYVLKVQRSRWQCNRVEWELAQGPLEEIIPNIYGIATITHNNVELSILVEQRCGRKLGPSQL